MEHELRSAKNSLVVHKPESKCKLSLTGHLDVDLLLSLGVLIFMKTVMSRFQCNSLICLDLLSSNAFEAIKSLII